MNSNIQNKSPTEFLKQSFGRPVIVKLTNGNKYKGKDEVNFNLGNLICLDGGMNLALEQCEEIINGQVENKYGDVYIRGNNGITSK